MKHHFSGKTALLAGGTCEIALKVAIKLMAAGITPVMSYRTDEGNLKIRERLQAVHGNFETCLIDYSRAETLESGLESTGRTFEYFVDFVQDDYEALIASADNDRVAGFFDQTLTFRAHLLKAVTRMMLAERRGRLLFVSSSAAIAPNKGQGFYSASKLAAEALYRNIGIEFGGRGITTVSLRPGYIHSGRGKRYLEIKGSEVLARIPTGRFLEPDEVADVIMFLLSDPASGINATEVVMDGGLTACK